MSPGGSATNIGALATRLGFVTPATLAEAVKLQIADRANGNDRPLGAVMVAHGFLSDAQLALLLKLQKDGIVPNEKPEDEPQGTGSATAPPGATPISEQRPPTTRTASLGALATRFGYLTNADLDRALETQREDRAIGYDRPLGEILIANGLITRAQLALLLKLQKHGFGPAEAARMAEARKQAEEKALKEKKARALAARAAANAKRAAEQAARKRRDSAIRPDQAGAMKPLGLSIPMQGGAPHPSMVGSSRFTLGPDDLPDDHRRPAPPPPRAGASPSSSSVGMAPPSKPASPSSSAQMRKLVPAKPTSPSASASGMMAPLQAGEIPADLAQWAMSSGIDVPAPGIAPGQVPQALPQIPGYKVVARLGQGGVGVVYKGRHLALAMDVAIKILRPTYSRQQDFVRRFFREARTCAKLNHLNIVRGVDAGQVGDLCFMVMEYVEGVTLQKLIAERAPLPAVPMIEVGCQVADALDHAWSQGLVHRDLKPENIMIVPDGGMPIGMALKRRAFTVKVMDLGLAKAAANTGPSTSETNITRVHQAIGTPRYMSPEQAQGIEVDIRSDIYSLGVTLYEALTGKAPFEAENDMALMICHVRDPVPDPRMHVPNLAPELVDVVNRLLAKSPDHRYATPGQLRQVLQAVALQMSGAQAQVGPIPTQRPSSDTWRSTTSSARRAAAAQPGPAGRPATPAEEDHLGHLKELGERLRRRRRSTGRSKKLRD